MSTERLDFPKPQINNNNQCKPMLSKEHQCNSISLMKNNVYEGYGNNHCNKSTSQYEIETSHQQNKSFTSTTLLNSTADYWQRRDNAKKEKLNKIKSDLIKKEQNELQDKPKISKNSQHIVNRLRSQSNEKVYDRLNNTNNNINMNNLNRNKLRINDNNNNSINTSSINATSRATIDDSYQKQINNNVNNMNCESKRSVINKNKSMHVDIIHTNNNHNINKHRQTNTITHPNNKSTSLSLYSHNNNTDNKYNYIGSRYNKGKYVVKNNRDINQMSSRKKKSHINNMKINSDIIKSQRNSNIQSGNKVINVKYMPGFLPPKNKYHVINYDNNEEMIERYYNLNNNTNTTNHINYINDNEQLDLEEDKIISQVPQHVPFHKNYFSNVIHDNNNNINNNNNSSNFYQRSDMQIKGNVYNFDSSLIQKFNKPGKSNNNNNITNHIGINSCPNYSGFNCNSYTNEYNKYLTGNEGNNTSVYQDIDKLMDYALNIKYENRFNNNSNINNTIYSSYLTKND